MSAAESTCVTPTRKSLISLVCPDRKSTRLNSSHSQISYAVFCLKKKQHIESTAKVPLRMIYQQKLNVPAPQHQTPDHPQITSIRHHALVAPISNIEPLHTALLTT